MNDPDKLRQQMLEIGVRYLRRTLSEVDTLSELSSAHAGGDAEALKQIHHLAHKIHGSGAMFGFTSISDCARDIEHHAGVESTAPDYNGRMNALIQALIHATQTAAKERGVA